MSQLILTGIGDVDDNVRLETEPRPDRRAGRPARRIEAATGEPGRLHCYAGGMYGVQPEIPSGLGPKVSGGCSRPDRGRP